MYILNSLYDYTPLFLSYANIRGTWKSWWIIGWIYSSTIVSLFFPKMNFVLFFFFRFFISPCDIIATKLKEPTRRSSWYKVIHDYPKYCKRVSVVYNFICQKSVTIIVKYLWSRVIYLARFYRTPSIYTRPAFLYPYPKTTVLLQINSLNSPDRNYWTGVDCNRRWFIGKKRV